jgi:hypothetical protein
LAAFSVFVSMPRRKWFKVRNCGYAISISSLTDPLEGLRSDQQSERAADIGNAFLGRIILIGPDTSTPFDTHTVLGLGM